MWASDTVKEWTGAIVHKNFAEQRHPQDFLRSRRENMTVPDARPEPVAQFQGPLITETTADASAGATTLSVVASARFAATDRIAIMLSSGDAHLATVTAVPTSTSIEFALSALPGAVASGAKVINYSATAS